MWGMQREGVQGIWEVNLSADPMGNREEGSAQSCGKIFPGKINEEVGQGDLGEQRRDPDFPWIVTSRIVTTGCVCRVVPSFNTL